MSLFNAGRAIQGQPLLSFEFFPPKDEDSAGQMLRTAEALRAFQPDFVSITYGAGGSTRLRTLDYTRRLVHEFGFRTMPHLTCVGHAVEELREILAAIRDTGAHQVMALRGDPPKGADGFEQHPGGFRHATDLVRLIRSEAPDFTIGVAGYPEKHPESPDAATDLRHLKEKVDAGADFITTQLFFDNADYFAFVERCRAIGITVPIIPGLMAILTRPQAERFCALCGTRIPEALVAGLDEAGDDPAAVEEVGRAWAARQVAELCAAGVPGIHLYILNRTEPTLRLLERIAADPAGAALIAGACAPAPGG